MRQGRQFSLIKNEEKEWRWRTFALCSEHRNSSQLVIKKFQLFIIFHPICLEFISAWIYPWHPLKFHNAILEMKMKNEKCLLRCLLSWARLVYTFVFALMYEYYSVLSPHPLLSKNLELSFRNFQNVSSSTVTKILRVFFSDAGRKASLKLLGFFSR